VTRITILFDQTMTPARRQGKPSATAAAAAAWLALIWAASAFAATTERVVTNPQTGLAIDGFDPVSYFIDAAALPGRPEFELRYRGAVWRFRNPGNLAAFRDHPSDYEPQFGGYDPVAIGRGAPNPGNPLFWLVELRRLYLFHGNASRDEFQANVKRLAPLAEGKWSDVMKVLAQ
jgi:hypothetical protein